MRRIAILAQLKHREETDLALLADVIDANLEGSLHGREFFVRKAIGWALRQHARVDPAVGAGASSSRAATGSPACRGARRSSTCDPDAAYRAVVVVIAAPTRR